MKTPSTCCPPIQCGFLEQQALRLSLVCRMLIEECPEMNTCGRGRQREGAEGENEATPGTKAALANLIRSSGARIALGNSPKLG